MQKDFIYHNYLNLPNFLDFSEAMEIYEALLLEAQPEVEAYEKAWDRALMAMVDYGSLRSHWKITPKTERSNDERTVMHDSVIHSLDVLAEVSRSNGCKAMWREQLGNQRKRIGDFACYVSMIYGLFAR